MHAQLDLDTIRSVLIRQEETLIFALVERAQFKVNARIYQRGGMPLPDFSGSFVEYLLHGTEALHATVRRYTSPDEHPFFKNLPVPILPALAAPAPIAATAVNINARIQQVYEQHIIPAVCAPGDDEQYGSSAVCDVACLQALSKRIHYGKFVAESKYCRQPAAFAPLLRAGDTAGVLALITDAAVEARLLRRVERKAATYGQEIDADGPTQAYKIPPRLIADIYRDWIIPLTKGVEVAYLLERRHAPVPA
jgi:chorismate mutase